MTNTAKKRQKSTSAPSDSPSAGVAGGAQPPQNELQQKQLADHDENDSTSTTTSSSSSSASNSTSSPQQQQQSSSSSASTSSSAKSSSGKNKFSPIMAPASLPTTSSSTAVTTAVGTGTFATKSSNVSASSLSSHLEKQSSSQTISSIATAGTTTNADDGNGKEKMPFFCLTGDPNISSDTFNSSNINSSNTNFRSLSLFKLTDFHPRRQRRCLVQLKQQQEQLIQKNIIPDITRPEKIRKEIRKDLPKMRSKDLDLPFKRSSTSSRLTKMFTAGSSASAVITSSFTPTGSLMPSSASTGQLTPLTPKLSLGNKAPSVSLQMIKLAILDDDDETAEQYLLQLPQNMLKKKRPFEANCIFLLAMSRRMERLALIILDRGFPPDVNAPIFTMKSTPKNSHNIPFKINASLFPSYFITAVAMGFETLVKYMIKLGASVNHPWYGLTPLHIALFCSKGHPNMSLVHTLLEFGADPWIGIYAEQLDSLVKLKEASCSLDPNRQRIPTVQQQLQAFKLASQLPEDKPHPVIPLSILGIPQRPVHQYLQQQTEADKNISEKINSWRKDKFILPVNFAVAIGHRPATLAILQRMSQLKPRKPHLPFGNTPGTSTATSSTHNNQPHPSLLPIISPQKDCLSLLLQQDLELVVYLLKSGVVDIRQKDPKGSNALHLAARMGNVDLIQILLHFDNANGDLINSYGENGWTALHEAISRSHLEVFKLLLKKGADSRIRNEFGDTAKDLGQKLGISITDLDQVWFGGKMATLMRTGTKNLSSNNLARLADSTSTILPGAGSSELLAHLDSKITRLLNAPLFEERKKSSALLDLAGSPLIWKTLAGGSSSILNPSSGTNNKDIIKMPPPSSASTALPAANSTETSAASALLDFAAPGGSGSGSKKSVRIPFSKILKPKNRKKNQIQNQPQQVGTKEKGSDDSIGEQQPEIIVTSASSEQDPESTTSSFDD